MKMYERIGFMRRHMELNMLREYRNKVQAEISNLESRLSGPWPSESNRMELRRNQSLLRKIETVIGEKENQVKEAVA